ncbi:MAG: glycosylase, partial [Clostridia bacterium]|nr:glycosylase [Clostridia bacterium]
CDGFRVDMAASLVKFDDDQKTGTSMVWLDVRHMLDCEFPEAAMVSEWDNPPIALRAGFDMDFYLNNPGNGYTTLLRDYGMDPKNPDNSYFRADSEHDITRFLKEYMTYYADTRDLGYISLITCNHDTKRPALTLSTSELKLAYAFIFTMPGVPFLYYGDEIGMRYLDLPTKEGGYFRTGSRTPMQWDTGKNLGFSSADAKDLYLPVDPSENAPTVAVQESDPDSLLNTVRALLQLRHAEKDLQADGDFEPLIAEKGRPFVYRRGSLIAAVNPGLSSESVKLDSVTRSPIYTIGTADLNGNELTLGPSSFVLLK